MLGRRRPAARFIVAVAVCLAIGAAVNVMVAWAVALRSPVVWEQLQFGQGGREWPAQVPDGWPMLPGSFARSDARGLEALRVTAVPWWEDTAIPSADPSLPIVLIHGPHTVEIYKAGWPWPCLSWHTVRADKIVYTINVRARSRTSQTTVLHDHATGLTPPAVLGAAIQPGRRFPTTPLWPGMLAGIAVYGFAAFLPLAGTGLLRRAVRRRRGLCPACGYSRAGLAGDPACPECGAAGASSAAT